MAHRGWHDASIPENSKEAFEKAANAGVGFETDVRTDAYGTPVIIHDRCIGDRTVSEMSVADMSRTLGHVVPTLGDLLETDWGVPINLEFKTTSAYEASRSMLMRHRGRDILMTSFIHSVAFDAARELGFEAGLLTASRPNGSWDMAGHGDRVRTVVWDFNVADAEAVGRLMEAGFASIVYGPVTRKEHEALAGMGLRAVITDHPQKALDAMASKTLVSPEE